MKSHYLSFSHMSQATRGPNFATFKSLYSHIKKEEKNK